MPDFSDPVYFAALLGLAIGIALGITVAWGRFCTMGAVADIVISGNFGRMRSWMLAICIAIIGVQLAGGLGLIELQESAYLRPQMHLAASIVGGLIFGFGMVIACGCGTRSLAMIGTGDLRALISVMVLGIVAYMTIRGIFAAPRSWFYEITFIDTSAVIPSPSINALFGVTTSTDSSTTRLLGALVVLLPLLIFVFSDREFLRTRRRVNSGVSVGLLVLAGWLSTGWWVNDDFDEIPTLSLTFVQPVGDGLQYLMFWTGTTITFGVAVVGGVVIGGLITALYRREFHLRGFEDAQEMGRYMGGGALMGIGGSLAGGCSFGQGITGVSTLAIPSIVALISIIFGAVVGVRYLEQGSIKLAIQNLWSRQ